MVIKIINPIDYPNWNDQIAEMPGATIFHTSNWAKVLAESYGYKPIYFCTSRQGRVHNIIPVMEANSPITGKRGVSLPFSDQVEPLVRDRGQFEKLFASMVSFGKEHGWKSITIHGGDEFFDNDKAFISYIDSSIQVNGPPEFLYKRFKSSNRRNIKKAEKSGLKTHIFQTQDAIESFYQLNCLSRKNHGLPPQPRLFFKSIHANVISKGNGFVCLASNDSEVIAGVVFFYFNRKALFKYGASNSRFLHLRPNNLSIWHAIRWCVENDCKHIDLGRSDLSHHGLLRFKRSWNSNEKLFNYYRYDIRKNRLTTDKLANTSSYKIFKRLPVPVLKIIGRVLYRHVG